MEFAEQQWMCVSSGDYSLEWGQEAVGQEPLRGRTLVRQEAWGFPSHVRC